MNLVRIDGFDIRFVGLSGGEIFHEMMLRQGVKHVCRSRHVILQKL